MSEARLEVATRRLHGALAEFVAAHKEHSGGTRPVLWATYRHDPDAILVVPQSWVPKLVKVMVPDAPQHVVQFEDAEDNTTRDRGTAVSEPSIGTRNTVEYEVHASPCESWTWTTGGTETVAGQPDRFPIEFRTPDGSLRRLYFADLETQERVLSNPSVYVRQRRL